ncbi:DUF2970 domain-containing protein [Cupriavidus sp. 30B13]|uniref:DUF2970 domain-containing protein n=1 Tax=Cupriavidus sp. 30B13 TaxID=3384241 RepID=UPI003B9212C2
MEEMKGAVKRKLSFLQTLRAVFWSFIGLRKGSEHERDMAQLNPVHVIIAGLVGVAILIAVLIAVVRVVVAG